MMASLFGKLLEILTSAHGLGVEFIVAIDETRVRVPVSAIFYLWFINSEKEFQNKVYEIKFL